MKKLSKTFFVKYPILGMLAVSVGIGFIIWLVSAALMCIRENASSAIASLFGGFLPYFLIASFLVSPIVVTLYNIGYLLVPHQSEITKKRGRVAEYFTVIYGGVCTFLYIAFFDTDIMWGSHWSDQLINAQVHSPVANEYMLTFGVLCIIAAAAYTMLRITGGRRLPPIPTALGIGGIYLGIMISVLWIIQFITREILLCVYPFNLILIAFKLIRDMWEAWRNEERDVSEGKNRVLVEIHTFLANSDNLPWVGFLAALPVFGICIAILTLFGQTPDSVIRVWTETADWTMSNHVGPPNIVSPNGHYLCTVAAGGHKKVVRPIRMGKRHGHEIIVNRQLSVANAFEQLLQERMPRFHKWVRHIYDKYGYPVAKHIRSPYAADAVWFIMKPLEWVFLLVLYTFDLKPENRIAVQYPHSTPPQI